MEYELRIKATNTLLILGNGFDLNCHLDSKFSDYFKEKKTQIVNNISDFSVNKICDNIWDLLLYFAFYDEQLETRRLFKKHNENEILWMDVESFIKSVILGNITTDKWLEKAQRAKYLSYISIIQDAYTDRARFVLGDTTQMNLLKQFFSWKKIDKSIDIYTFLYEELLDFGEQFKKFIKDQLTDNDAYLFNAKTLLRQLVEPEETFSIITFNYTMPLAKNLDEKLHCNIHGTINDRIIIGYDSSDQNDNETKGIRLSKSWQKMNSDSHRYKLPSKNEIKKIKIYGHSLGPQDYAYFHAIFDYYDIYDGDVVLYFCYTPYKACEEENNDIRDGFVSSVYKLLNDYAFKSGKESKVHTIVTKLQIENRIKIKPVPKI